MHLDERSLEERWDEHWKMWWATLDQIHGGPGDPWEPEDLAVFLDVVAMGIREMIPGIAKTTLLKSFDLLEEVRRTARRGLREIERFRGPLENRRLVLETYSTEMILLWEAEKFSRDEAQSGPFVDRVRDLREASPEIEMDDGEVIRFLYRLAGIPYQLGKV